ncbi:hypothetical protein [Myxococcus phage Mx1]|nr:hypothetical protein [Myxococcus phage Mx1]
MGVQAKTMHGSRAQVMIDGQIIGIFTNVSYGVRYDATPIFVLGRFSAAEIVLTGMEAINVSCSGFRVVDNGPYKVASVPRLQDLLNHEDISLSIFDRQTGKQVMTVVGVRPVGYSTSVAAKGIQDLSVEFMGLVLSDENDPNGQDETPGATEY